MVKNCKASIRTGVFDHEQHCLALPVAGGGGSMRSASTCCSLAYYARHIVNIAPEGEATSREQSGTPQRAPGVRFACS